MVATATAIVAAIVGFAATLQQTRRRWLDLELERRVMEQSGRCAG
jgi:hypothetical protein